MLVALVGKRGMGRVCVRAGTRALSGAEPLARLESLHLLLPPS